MSLDVNSPRGQQTVADEQEVRRLMFRLGYRYVETAKDGPALVDAILTDRNARNLVAVAETKCRYDVTHDEFVRAYRNEWLVTWEKIAEGMRIARAMRLMFLGVLYLVKSRTVLTVRIAEASGLLVAPIRLQATETQATCNGGRALRTNAYIDMRGARVFPIDQPTEEAA